MAFVRLLATLTMQAVIPVMRDQGAGTIVNVSSGTTFSVIPESGACAASKAGLNLLSSTARAELQSVGITVSTTMYLFVTGTEFVDAYRAGKEAAAEIGRQQRHAASAPRTRRRNHPRPDQVRCRAPRPCTATVRRHLQPLTICRKALGLRASRPRRTRNIRAMCPAPLPQKNAHQPPPGGEGHLTWFEGALPGRGSRTRRLARSRSRGGSS